MAFTFLNYAFNEKTNTAIFRYKGKNDLIFTEKALFPPSNQNYNKEALDAALFLAFIVIGTSYYKTESSSTINLKTPLDKKQAIFFNHIYQEGLSQFAFENHLTRQDLAHFSSSPNAKKPTLLKTPLKDKTLILLSGGKDSLLMAEKVRSEQKPYEVLYISAQESYPKIIDEFKAPLIVRRFIDQENLRRASGLNGHVPVTLINESLAIIVAILTGCNKIELGIGKEGLEPHTYVDDLPINHQWSKTPEAQTFLKNYLKTYIAKNLTIGSLLKNYTEIKIAQEFAKSCWKKYGSKFSSCNIANYQQNTNNRELKWCKKCAKCANSYLLFAPFIPYEEQKKLFSRDLFKDPEMTEIFKGLLGVDGVMKPFECIASIKELRWAYKNRLPGYGELPFKI